MPQDDDSETESDNDEEGTAETDQDRRKAMLEAMQDTDLDSLGYGFPDDFEFNLPSPGSAQGGCDLPSNNNSGSTFTNKGKDKATSQNEGTSSPSFSMI